MATPALGRDGPLTVQLDPDGGSLTVRATGELDIATTETLRRALHHALDGGAKSIVLDLAGVTFIDSVGLRTLIWASEHSDGSQVGIRCGSGAVRRMIEMTGLEQSLPLVE